MGSKITVDWQSIVIGCNALKPFARTVQGKRYWYKVSSRGRSSKPGLRYDTTPTEPRAAARVLHGLRVPDDSTYSYCTSSTVHSTTYFYFFNLVRMSLYSFVWGKRLQITCAQQILYTPGGNYALRFLGTKNFLPCLGRTYSHLQPLS